MPPTNLPNVLVVDDEPELRELLLDALSTSHVQVSLAASGREAIDMARRVRPDLVVTDLCLGDCTGLDVLDHIRSGGRDMPAVVITGHTDPASLTEASRHGVSELMAKPLDLDRLRLIVQSELARQDRLRTGRSRLGRLRRLARQANIDKKLARRKLNKTCCDLTSAYRSLTSQMGLQQAVIAYQQHLLKATNDDDVFRSLFGLFVRRTGPLFGVAMVCDDKAELQMAGRFGVPYPDDSAFCTKLVKPVIAEILAKTECVTMDAESESDLFDASIRRFLPGLSILAMPLIPCEGELIGVVVLYRKGEQPFTDDDQKLAEMIGPSTALAVRRND